MTFRKPRRAIHTVWIHCSAASRPSVTAADVDSWHKQRGWKGIGYHYFIRTDGTLEEGRALEHTGAHVRGHNRGSIGICLNGLHVKDFTAAQFETLKKLCVEIDEAYGPGTIKFRGHKEVAAKACPVFDYKKVLELAPGGVLGDLEGEPEMKEEPATAVSQKPIATAKEITACSGALTASGAVLSSTSGVAQIILAIGLTVALCGIVGVVAYRVIAKKNRTR